jgi:hypothetical protein
MRVSGFTGMAQTLTTLARKRADVLNCYAAGTLSPEERNALLREIAAQEAEIEVDMTEECEA